LETRGRGRSQGLSKIFRAATYRAHRAVVFAIARLSCYNTVQRNSQFSFVIPQAVVCKPQRRSNEYYYNFFRKPTAWYYLPVHVI